MALLGELAGVARAYAPLIICALVVVYCLRNKYQKGLNQIPGPFWASISDLWNFVHVCSGQSTSEYQLHQKYDSPLLRMGPNYVSCSDPESIRVIYGWKRVFKKSDHYLCQNQFSKEGIMVENISAVLDEERHSKLKRAIAHAYAMTTIKDFEPLVDSTSRTFMYQVNKRFAETGATCPLDKWLQMYAFDIIGELTFSKQFGFLKSGTDLDNMMHHTGKAMEYIGTIGQLPAIDYWFRIKNPLLRIRQATTNVVLFTVKQIQDHMAHPDSKNIDFTTRFVASAKKWPEIIDEPQLYELINTNVAAGSDTTGIALRQVVYSMMTHPQVFQKFMDELKDVLKAREGMADSTKPITWQEGNSMKYLQAVIKECLRCHPALGEILPRVVPPGGVSLCGQYIPEGTVIGCNAWTIHQDRGVFGEDADKFRPERWIDNTTEAIYRMDAMSFHFGAGNRMCIGRHIALLEMTKFIPEFFRRFEIELVDPSQWKFKPGWIVPQEGLDAYIRPREPLPYQQDTS
ncbi:cytochrome P450 oxidoreductase [Exophiala viscosa]|uniref:Cytochrome P450 oxidoreductase n=1 Tax=Exophiala viscosa TaxID=2486360 RepID=A0AAN6DYF4_9EURO|nr:cytochrome P450 oxidoreductase [Exophiala viscosa]KAI1622640.1 cytochrome P450 oxidoreductase [Exophiala viscosa]